MRDDDWYKPHHDRPAPPPRQPRAGEEVWRLKDRAGRGVRMCELHDDSKAGAGWDVLLLEGGEAVFSRRCGNEREARYVAEVLKQDTLRVGWSEE
jgi:hypothetical protein